MNRRLLIGITAVVGLVILSTGILIGVLIASDDDNNDGGAETPSTSSKSTYLGVSVASGRDGGLRILSVDQGSPADKAGLEVGDVIRSVDGQIVRTTEQLRDAITSHSPGSTVKITYERSDQELQAEARLGAAPTATAPSSTPAASATARPTATPTPDRSVINELLRQLPTQIRQRAQAQLDACDLTLDDVQRLLDNLKNARAATIIDVSANELHGRTFLGEEFTTAIDADTVILRGRNEISAIDLKPDEIVLIFSDDNGLTATGIQAFGVFGSDLP